MLDEPATTLDLPPTMELALVGEHKAREIKQKGTKTTDKFSLSRLILHRSCQHHHSICVLSHNVVLRQRQTEAEAHLQPLHVVA